MKQLLFISLVFLVGCSSAPTSQAGSTDKTLLYTWSDFGRLGNLRKVIVDGQEYLIASSSEGVSIIRHDKPFVWDSTNTEPGDIIVGTIKTGDWTVSVDSTTYSESKQPKK